jgi:hypothetical protein
MSRRVRAFIIPAGACLAVWIGAHWLRPPFVPLGGDIQEEIAQLEAVKPDILLIGNSYLAAAVEPDGLSRKTGRRCMILKRGGSASACWYLMLKNVLRPARHVPLAVVLYFRDNELTLPAFHTGGRARATQIEPLSTTNENLLEQLAYRESDGRVLTVLKRLWPVVDQRERIKTNAELGLQRLVLSLFQKTDARSVGRIFNYVFADFRMNKELLSRRQLAEEMATAASRSMFDFSEREPRSFLPSIIRLVREKGSRLILARHRCRYHAMGIPDAQPLREYMAQLRSYLAGRGIVMIDFSQESSIELKHFLLGDHFDGELAGFNDMLSSRLLPLLPAGAGAKPSPPRPGIEP